MSGGRGEGGTREVSPLALLSARGPRCRARAEAHLEEGGSWGKHGFPHGREQKASDRHARLTRHIGQSSHHVGHSPDLGSWRTSPPRIRSTSPTASSRERSPFPQNSSSSP